MQQPITTTYPFVKATLPLPPGINNSYKIVEVQAKQPSERAFRKGMVVDATAYHRVRRLGATQELETFKEQAAWTLKDKHHTSVEWDLVEIIRASKARRVPLKITIKFFYSTLWKRDIDGGEKAVIDAVFAHIGLNDNLIVEKHTQKFADHEDPRVEIEISCVVGR